jgi:hypothetical protein
MSTECKRIHEITRSLDRHRFPFDNTKIPRNGIYVLFEKGEEGHVQEGGRDRIVRIGTHTGDKQLTSRLKEHFLKENKDRSIFRKNIGRALLNKQNDNFLEFWNLDLTTRRAKDIYAQQIDFEYQRQIEYQVSQYIHDNFSFSVFEVATKEERLNIESKIISTVSLCDECMPSNDWLGKSSPNDKIVRSGLWLVNQLYKESFDVESIEYLSQIIGHSPNKN